METTTLEYITSEDTLMADSKGVHDPSRFDLGDTDVANDDTANKETFKKHEFVLRLTQEDAAAMVDIRIGQMKVDRAAEHLEGPVDYAQHDLRTLCVKRKECIGVTSSSLKASRYGLAGRPKCRYGFPLPIESQQQCSKDTDMLTWRIHHSKDQSVVNQASEKQTVIPGQVNIESSDSKANFYDARCYINKYVSKSMSYSATIACNTEA